MTEKELQAAVVELAGYLKWRCYHTYDSRRSNAGFPDLTMVRYGRLIFAELKSEKGKATTVTKRYGSTLSRKWATCAPIYVHALPLAPR